MTAYYNENDPQTAAWLRALIDANLIAPGDVDVRSICDVTPSDLEGYTQCHFFAGIGGWSYALRLAGWLDDRPVWTGSCPCQPFSTAGKGLGTADERHLWPELRRLIAERRPAVCFGEQVAGAAGREWLSGVRTDLEGLDYAVGAADLCSASVGAPHIRQRLFWVAYGNRKRPDGLDVLQRPERYEVLETPGSSGAGGMADNHRIRGAQFPDGARQGQDARFADRCAPGGMGHSVRVGREGPFNLSGAQQAEEHQSGHESVHRGDRPRTDYVDWRDCDWLGCRDARWRAVEPGTFPLDARIPKGMGGRRKALFRGYGNSIVPQVAAQFIGAWMEVVDSAPEQG